MKKFIKTIAIIILCICTLAGCTKQKPRRNTQNIRLLEAGSIDVNNLYHKKHT